MRIDDYISVNKNAMVNKNNLIKETKTTKDIDLNSVSKIDLPNNEADRFSQFPLQDIDESTEIYVKNKVNIYKDHTIQDLENILNDESKLRDFYYVYNTSLYNNFHDISKIIYHDYLKEDKINLNLNQDGNKLNLSLITNEGIEFVANSKSLPRIVEKMKRKNKTHLNEITDVIRGRINTSNIYQAKEILRVLESELVKQNKEIIEVEDMITNPRETYKGRVHLLIKDNETGAVFELQLGPKSITEFIERPVTINYGQKEIVTDKGTILVEDETLNSNYHDLIYKCIPKLKTNPKFEKFKNDFEKIERKYLEIQDKIYKTELEGTYEKNKPQIEQEMAQLDKMLISVFSKIDKNYIIKSLEE